MANITSKDIRNICLLGHGGCGKTSLIEAFLYYTKAVARMGKTADGNTVSDYDSEEIKRGFSISSSLVPVYYKDKKINFIDTPGYLDFSGEVHQALRIARNAIIVINAKAGIEVGTDIAWDAATDAGVARSFFINHLDEPDVDYKGLVQNMKNNYGNAVCPIIVPYFENGKATCFVNLIENVSYTYDANGKRTESPVAPEVDASMQEYKQMLFEALAETSDELMEKYFAEEPFTHEEMVEAVYRGLDKGSIAPVFAGSAVSLAGVAFLLSMIASSFPSPIARGYERDVNGEKYEISETGPASIFVWKTIADQFVGKMSFIKVISGTLKREDMLKDMRTGNVEKVVHLYENKGKDNQHTEELICGDLGVITKLTGVNTNDTLNANSEVEFRKIKFPKPYLCLAVKPKAKGDEDKIASGITKLLEEDCTIRYEVNSETKQILLYGLGEMHLDIIVTKLKNRFGTEVTLDAPKIAYRETIKKPVEIQGKYKKQSGGHGQYGDVWIRFAPGEEDGLTFTESVVGGAVPKNFFPAVEKGLLESMQKGVLAGFPVVKLAANLYDGSYHPVDSSEMSFKLAANVAYKEGLPKANPIILEPVGKLTVTVPERLMGDVMGDLPKRRGTIISTTSSETKNGYSVIEAEVPQAEMANYSVTIRAMSGGRGSFAYEITGYAEAPQAVAQKIIADAAKASEE